MTYQMRFSLFYFENVQVSEKLNHTHLILIPKVPYPETIEQFRPIELCNFSYKVIARIITHCMRAILGSIVDDSQSAFVPKRLTADDILIAHELMHFLKRRKKGKVIYRAMKLDMYKAYNRIEWSFLGKILVTLGFSVKWTSLIMECISTVTYSIKVNGWIEGSIKPC